MITRARSALSGSPAVVWVGIAMIVVQLAYRTWALAGGWFLIDDYGFLSDAVGQKLTLSYLTTVHNDHLEPIGFLVAWVVGHSSPFDWTLATVITLCLQALASAACLLFLVRLAGPRWGILVPLGFYLFSVVTLPGFLWWCVATLQVPQQLAAFLAMTSHLEYVRSRRRRFVVLTCLAICLGMLSDVKVAFVGPALVFLSLYVGRGTGWRERLTDAVWRQRLAWVAYGVLFAAYLLAYLHLNPLTGRSSPDRVGVFQVMLRYTLGPTFLGGPWDWGPMADTPLVPAQPPEWAVTITWVVLALVLLRAVRRHRTAAWAVVPFAVCLLINVEMVSAARGSIFGQVLGLEVRYTGDLAPSIVLMLAVLATGLRATTVRAVAPPLPVGRAGRVLTAAVVVVALVGMAVSTQKYVANWHSDFPAKQYTQNVLRQTEHRQLDLVDQPVPLDVVPSDDVVKDVWRPSALFKQLGSKVLTSFSGNDLSVLDARGLAYPAAIVPHVASPEGPVRGCGYQATTRPVTIRLEPVAGTSAPSAFWYASIGYLSSSDGTATLRFGDDTTTAMRIERGLHTYVFLGNGSTDSVTLTPGSPMTLCVDTVEVGDLVPFGGRLSAR